MTYSIDRFEGDLAVLCDEEENTRNVPRAALPAEAAVGDMLTETAEGFAVDVEATEARRELVRRLQEKLRGDV